MVTVIRLIQRSQLKMCCSKTQVTGTLSQLWVTSEDWFSWNSLPDEAVSPTLNELKVMKYREAVNGPDGEYWKEQLVNEHNKMLKNKIFKTVDKLPPSNKPIDSTWVYKLKSNVTTCINV